MTVAQEIKWTAIAGAGAAALGAGVGFAVAGPLGARVGAALVGTLGALLGYEVTAGKILTSVTTPPPTPPIPGPLTPVPIDPAPLTPDSAIVDILGPLVGILPESDPSAPTDAPPPSDPGS